MTETGAQRFEAAWREACANGENVAEAIGRLLDEQGARLARVEALVYSPQADKFRDEACRGTVGLPYANNRYVRLLDDLRAALAPEAEGA